MRFIIAFTLGVLIYYGVAYILLLTTGVSVLP